VFDSCESDRPGLSWLLTTLPVSPALLRSGQVQPGGEGTGPGEPSTSRCRGKPGGKPASPLEARHELVKGALVVDVKPSLLLPPVTETHDRTDVEEPFLAVYRCAQALGSQHMVVST
jgi:hypothetical protein